MKKIISVLIVLAMVSISTAGGSEALLADIFESDVQAIALTDVQMQETEGEFFGLSIASAVAIYVLFRMISDAGDPEKDANNPETEQLEPEIDGRIFTNPFWF